ncbi:MAG: methionyl-tRNA formyltransferase [Gammaproteobacteria bacterium]|jgi:methionyl-tRNA formyltransferase
MPDSLKIIFAGTPEFAAKFLQSLLNAKYDICAVITQPDKPAGRGRKLQINPVKQLSLIHKIPIYQPKTLRDAAAQKTIKDLHADIIIDVACGLLIPKEILSLPHYGCVNVHPSLLPRWRGASPIQRAILAGDEITGVSIMQMDEGLDTGPVFLQKEFLIKPTDTTKSLLEELALLGIDALLNVLDKIHEITPTKQNEKKACYAKKITKEEAKIDWHKSAITLDREIRAFNPWPISYTQIGDQIIRIWQASPLTETCDKKPGEIVKLDKKGIDVATGDGMLRILKMQFPGKKALTIAEILNSKLDFFEKHKKFN